jgi:hypothetical protein
MMGGARMRVLRIARNVALAILAFTALGSFAAGSAWERNRPTHPDATKGLVVPYKGVAHVVFITEGEQLAQDRASIVKAVAFLVAFASMVMLERQGRRSGDPAE